MSALLMTVPATRLPSASWRAAITAWRREGRPEVAVALLLRAGKPGKLSGEGITAEEAAEAVALCGRCEVRNEARRRRLNGLRRRLMAERPKPASPGREYALVGMFATALRIVPSSTAHNHYSAVVRATGSHGEMHTLLNYSLRQWTRLPSGREVETAAAEIAAAAARPKEQPLPFDDERPDSLNFTH